MKTKKVVKKKVIKASTLDKFLKQCRACNDGYEFAKDLTLAQFLKTCHRGDWILWLFARMNPESLKELTLVKAHCANTVRHLMKDERSTKAIDIAIKFGNGKATRNELDNARSAADAADAADADAADAAADAADAAAYAAYAAADAAAYAAYAAARKKNQKQTADICRKYLPLKIWDQSKL